MGMTKKELKQVAKEFKRMTLGKYKLVIVEEDEQNYLYDLSNPTEDGFDQLVENTLLSCFNSQRTLPPPKKSSKPKKKKRISPYGNHLLWEQTTKKRQ